MASEDSFRSLQGRRRHLAAPPPGIYLTGEPLVPPVPMPLLEPGAASLAMGPSPSVFMPPWRPVSLPWLRGSMPLPGGRAPFLMTLSLSVLIPPGSCGGFGSWTGLVGPVVGCAAKVARDTDDSRPVNASIASFDEIM